MYGASLRLVTRMPREARIAARDAAAMPFPREETTPPVTKTNLVMEDKSWKFLFYRNPPFGTNLKSHCGEASRRFTPSWRVAHAWRQSEARLDARAYGLAPKQREHRVDRRALRNTRDERTHSHHDLGRLEALPCRDRFDCRATGLAGPVDPLDL